MRDTDLQIDMQDADLQGQALIETTHTSPSRWLLSLPSGQCEKLGNNNMPLKAPCQVLIIERPS